MPCLIVLPTLAELMLELLSFSYWGGTAKPSFPHIYLVAPAAFTLFLCMWWWWGGVLGSDWVLMLFLACWALSLGGCALLCVCVFFFVRRGFTV